jgi:hypothetical protein
MMATLDWDDSPSDMEFKTLKRCRARAASVEFDKLVPPRSSLESKSRRVNG